MELQQRNDEWFKLRQGRFTASRINDLLAVKGFGKVAENYIFEKAIEIVYGEDEEENIVTYDMQRGINLEPLAFRKFSELKELEFIEVKNAYFFPYKDYAGASPDGLVGSDAVLEIKCPRYKKFFNIVANGIDAIDDVYYDQMQMQMMCSNSVRCHFFNYIIFNGKEMWHELIVERDEERINLIKERLEKAVKLRDEFVQYLIEKQQF